MTDKSQESPTILVSYPQGPTEVSFQSQLEHFKSFLSKSSQDPNCAIAIRSLLTELGTDQEHTDAICPPDVDSDLDCSTKPTCFSASSLSSTWTNMDDEEHFEEPILTQARSINTTPRKGFLQSHSLSNAQTQTDTENKQYVSRRFSHSSSNSSSCGSNLLSSLSVQADAAGVSTQADTARRHKITSGPSLLDSVSGVSGIVSGLSLSDSTSHRRGHVSGQTSVKADSTTHGISSGLPNDSVSLGRL